MPHMPNFIPGRSNPVITDNPRNWTTDEAWRFWRAWGTSAKADRPKANPSDVTWIKGAAEAYRHNDRDGYNRVLKAAGILKV